MWTTSIASQRAVWHARARRTAPLCRSAAHNNYDALVHELLTAPEHSQESLRAFVKQHKIGTQFLVHLRAREEAAEDEEQEKLWWLGSRLMVLLEGLDEAAYEAVVSEAAMVQQQGQGGLVCLEPEALALLEGQAAALRESMARRKDASITALLGRAEGGGVVGEDAASRILDVLLEADDAVRRELLPQAFQEVGDEDAAAEDEELLSTTPLLLLQAIERRMRGDDDQDNKMRAALQTLRGEVLEWVLRA